MIRRAAASLPLAIAILQVTAVGVLLPDIRLDLGSSPSGAQWVLNGYLLALAALFPVLAPLRGRALTIAGALVMAGGAIVSARAGSTSVLVVGQALQGAGTAALVAPPAGSWAALALPAGALAFGPLAGGVFAEQNWWHVFFWAGVPLAALAGAAALAAPRPVLAAGVRRPLAFAAGLTALTIGLVQGEVWGWGWTAALLLAGAVLLGRSRLNELPGDSLVWAALAGCLTALLFLLPEYLQLARNLSGSRSGVLLLALTLAAVGGWTVAGWLGRRLPAVAGLACLAAGLAVLIAIHAHTRWAVVIGGVGLTGLGIGVTGARTAPGSLTAVLTGATVGLAAAGAAFQAGQADERDAGATFEQALAAGVGWAAVMLIALLAASALLTWRQGRAATPASSEARPAAGS